MASLRLPAVIALSLGLTAGITARAAYVEGPPPAHTGGFGEPTCQQCHFDGPLNDPAGTLRLLGVPAEYEPGRAYRITIEVSSPGMRRAGFQLAARFADGPEAGGQAGTLRALDSRARVTSGGAPEVQYASHVQAGTEPQAPDTARWRLEWTAPRRGGRVLFHIAANAADDDASPLGDLIHATSASTDPGRQ